MVRCDALINAVSLSIHKHESGCVFCFKRDYHLYRSSVGRVIKCPVSACMWTVSLMVDPPIHGSALKFETFVFDDIRSLKPSSETVNWAFFVLPHFPPAL